MEDQKILLYVLKRTEGKIAFDELAQELGCSANAITKHIGKIRKSVADDDQAGPGTPDHDKTALKVVQKRKRSAKAVVKQEGKDKKVKVEKTSEENVQSVLYDGDQE